MSCWLCCALVDGDGYAKAVLVNKSYSKYIELRGYKQYNYIVSKSIRVELRKQ